MTKLISNFKFLISKRKSVLFFILLFTIYYLLFTSFASAHSEGIFWTPGEPIVSCGAKLSGGGQCIDMGGTRECLGGPNPGNFCNDDSDCGNQPTCTQCELLHTGKHVIDFVLIAAAPVLATLFFVYAGALLMIGGANPGMLSQGKTIFKNTLIGLLIVMLAWLITNTLIHSLVDPAVYGGGNWWKFSCDESGIKPIP